MKIWTFLRKKIEENKSCILLVVIDHSGSSPGQAGFKMGVSEDSELSGSIGGGMTEYRLVENARKKLKLKDERISLKQEIHEKDVTENQSGMICSGEQWVAFYPVEKKDLKLIKTLESVTEEGKPGTILFNQDGISYFEDEREHHSHKNRVTSDQEWELKEQTGHANEIYIFGAGHVGLALSKLMFDLDFRIHLCDDRKDVNTMRDNKYTHTSEVVDYKNISGKVPEGDNIYTVIMTFGHKSDEVVLRQLISKKLKYLGMMGSKRKVANIFKNMEVDGFSTNLFSKIDAPIGLPIESQTPAEIAISIAAKIIDVKNS